MLLPLLRHSRRCFSTVGANSSSSRAYTTSLSASSSSKETKSCRDWPVLTDVEVEEKLKKIKHWTLQMPTSVYGKRTLNREFKQRNFKEVMQLANRIGEVAELQGHHPDMHIHSYNKLEVDVLTHSLHDLTDNDFRLVENIDLVTQTSTARRIYCMVAVSSNGYIGLKDGGLPWNIPHDFQYFKDMTANSVMIEGPKCYEELGGALPNRETIVVSRSRSDGDFPDATRVTTFLEGLLLANQNKIYRNSPIWVAGGEYIYNVGLPYVSKLYITRIHKEIDENEGGAKFPSEWQKLFTKKVFSEHHVNEQDGLEYTFEHWEREQMDE